MTELEIDGERLTDRLAELAAIGGIEGTAGSSRLAFTAADGAGRDLVRSWMTDLGLSVSVDSIGNVVGVQPGPDGLAPVMMGSHIDTVATGGRYDGNLGVLAGLEVIETLATAGVKTRRPLAVAFFSNEEGARYAPDMMGSLVYVGGLSVEEAHDTVGIDGTRAGAELERIGYLGAAPVPGLVPHAFVELHIEQGPVLEEAGTQIGVVEGVQGISWTEVTLVGQSNHAGTTPMRLRRDPGVVAAQLAVFVRDLVLELGAPQVGTVGRFELAPSLVNVVPASAVLTVDLRNTSDEVLAEAERRVETRLHELAAAEGIEVATRPLARFAPVAFDADLVDLVESSATTRGLSNMRLPSGAGHDAQMLARVCPTAMIFTPSHRGVSHNPAEHTDAADLRAGANVLLDVVRTLAT